MWTLQTHFCRRRDVPHKVQIDDIAPRPRASYGLRASEACCAWAADDLGSSGEETRRPPFVEREAYGGSSRGGCAAPAGTAYFDKPGVVAVSGHGSAEVSYLFTCMSSQRSVCGEATDSTKVASLAVAGAFSCIKV